MKKRLLLYITAATFTFFSCSDFLDIDPLDKVPPGQVYNDINGIKTLLATLYIKMPVECFAYNPTSDGGGFNYHNKPGSNWVDLGWGTTFYTDESLNSSGYGVRAVGDGYWGYSSIRQINQFIETLSEVEMSQEEYNRLKSEAHFIRAYTYFGLAKRYGGVPIIMNVQQMGDGDALLVPRSTEKETWDFILAECDEAIKHLPKEWTAEQGPKRATVWAAYALKSRAALFAASVAKHWDKAPLVGDAVTQKLVGGMTIADANNYYKKCIEASMAIIDQSGKSLYKPNPANPEEAAKNYQAMFENPTLADVMKEVIFSKGYIIHNVEGGWKQGHSIDALYNPAQTNPGFWAYGRFSPALDLVDIYEDYTDDGQGKSVPIQTRTDGAENTYLANPINDINVNDPYIKYTDPSQIFAGKDARLFASIIMPGSTWKGVKINIQGGLIKTDGTPVIYSEGEAVGNDGKTYYSYGAKTSAGYSGFKGMGNFDDANNSCTGFLLRKFLQEGKNVQGKLFSSNTDYIDFRLAEIYLNYAEAVAESGLGDAGKAAQYLNAIRHRAAHTDNIPLTIDNVLKERRVELAFEGHRYWDLVRRRDYHTVFNNTTRKSLVPVLDLRTPTPSYIFVRANNFYDQRANGQRFEPKSYYLPIPGISTNKLVQNPQY